MNELDQYCKHYNLSPQGDGNFMKESYFSFATITTYPRKGTVTCWYRPSLQCRDITTYPRKGTETDLLDALVIRLTNYNLSPQGDGNRFASISLQ